MRNYWMLILGLLLTACGGTLETTAPRAEQITCTVAYRSSVEVGIESEDTLTFSENDDELWLTFGEMVFHAAYRSGMVDNERHLRVWVTDANETTMLHSTLYQLPIGGGPQNQFMGGHGFTGLSYSYIPGSPAEMQYWCEVAG